MNTLLILKSNKHLAPILFDLFAILDLPFHDSSNCFLIWFLWPTFFCHFYSFLRVHYHSLLQTVFSLLIKWPLHSELSSQQSPSTTVPSPSFSHHLPPRCLPCLYLLSKPLSHALNHHIAPAFGQFHWIAPWVPSKTSTHSDPRQKLDLISDSLLPYSALTCPSLWKLIYSTSKLCYFFSFLLPLP